MFCVETIGQPTAPKQRNKARTNWCLNTSLRLHNTPRAAVAAEHSPSHQVVAGCAIVVGKMTFGTPISDIYFTDPIGLPVDLLRVGLKLILVLRRFLWKQGQSIPGFGILISNLHR